MKCISCGAEIKFDPKLNKLKCNYCNKQFEVDQYENEIKNADENVVLVNEIESKSYTCNSCGATLLTFDDTAITFCSYCGSSMAVEPELYKEGKPDLVIPFRITKEECEKKYKQKINSLIFAPSYMKDKIEISKFRGIYMPYCIYKFEYHGIQNNKGSKPSHRSGDYIIYNDYQIACDLDCKYDGISYDIASNFEDRFGLAVGPYRLKDAVPFKTGYLSGFYADSRDVDKMLYEEDAKKVAKKYASISMRKIKEIEKYNATDNVDLNNTNVMIAYFPVYFLAIKNKKNNLVNYAVVNGHDGKIVIESPVSFIKYTLFLIGLALIIFVILNTSLVLKPNSVAIFAIIMSFITLIFSNSQLNKLYIRENNLDDKGMSSKTNENKKRLKKMKFKSKFSKYLYKQTIGIILAILIMILNPVEDMYYYGVSIISLLLVLWSFSDLIKQHNELVSRKFKQLEARGGDENA